MIKLILSRIEQTSTPSAALDMVGGVFFLHAASNMYKHERHEHENKEHDNNCITALAHAFTLQAAWADSDSCLIIQLSRPGRAS